MAEEATSAMNLTVTVFKLWSTHTLKNYLAIRKNSGEGSHQDLAVRAFACYKNNVPLTSIWNRIITQEKLNTDSFKVPDPLSIKSNWAGEEKDKINWPGIYLHDIAK